MLRTFIQITSLILTLEAAIFLAKGNLGLSAQAIAELSSTKWDYNSDLIANLASQRADTWVGTVLLMVAFFLQMANALWPMSWADLSVHKGAAVYAFVFCLVLGFGAFFLSREIAASTEDAVKQTLKIQSPAVSEKTQGPEK